MNPNRRSTESLVTWPIPVRFENSVEPSAKSTPFSKCKYPTGGPEEFYSSDLGDFVFHPDADHRVSAFSLSTQASPGIVFERANGTEHARGQSDAILFIDGRT